MINPIILKSDELFVRVPVQNHVPTLREFYESIGTNLPLAIDQCCLLIKSEPSSDNLLKLWEIRLILLLFNNNLPQAKAEAISLNNVLYLGENMDTVAALEPGKVHPLPRNNNGTIDHDLMMLLLRLKSNPNLALINEIYKLCYQMRLKSSPNLSFNLIKLSYDIIVILVINKNYLTLINFLKSLINEIDLTAKKDYVIVQSHLKLLLIIITILVLDSNDTKHSSIESQILTHYSSVFDTLHIETKLSLVYVLRTINSVFSSDTTDVLDINIDELTFPKLISLGLDGVISGRIICCTLGIWHLQNTYKFELKNSKFVPNYTPTSDPHLSDCFDLVTSQWCDNIQRVYGLE